MQITTVTPQFVNQPKKPGGKYGSIKDGNGTYWSVPVGLLPHFKPNEPASVEWEMNGEYYNIKGIVGHAAQQPAPAPQPLPPPVRAPQPIAPTTNGHAVPMTEAERKERTMAIMAVIGKAAGNGNLGPTDVKLWIFAVDDAWDELLSRWRQRGLA